MVASSMHKYHLWFRVVPSFPDVLREAPRATAGAGCRHPVVCCHYYSDNSLKLETGLLKITRRHRD